MKRFGFLSVMALGLMSPLVASCQTTQGEFSLNETSIQMTQYDEYALSCTYKGIVPSEVTWNSSNNAVATIHEGVVTSCGVGRATITAAFGDASYRCEVLVTRSTVGRALVLSESSVTLDYLLREEKQVYATLKENGEEIPANIVWESADPNVVRVTDDGLLQSVGRGSAMVSAFCMHKGQKFQKSLLVKSVSYSFQEAHFELPEQGTGSSLTPYDDSTTGYFADAKESFRYVSGGGESSRLFVSDCFENGKPKADRLVFQLKFETAPSAPLRVAYGSAGKSWIVDTSLRSGNSGFLLFDYKYRIAEGVRLAKNYYVVLNLNKFLDGETFGFYFDEATTCYVSTPFLCSDDYLFEFKGFEKPYELPKLNYCYAESRLGLPLGDADIEGLDHPYWVMKPTGSNSWTEEAWTNRVAIGGITYADYRKFNYEYMNVMFEDVNFNQVVFWTGGYAFRIDNRLNMSSTETGSFQADDFFVYQGDRQLKAGEALLPNVDYTFKVRIQKKDTENVAFGINVVSASDKNIYLSNPDFRLI